MGKLRKTSFKRIAALSLAGMMALSLLLSACGSREQYLYLENELRIQLPLEAADQEVLEGLLQELYIREGDLCAFRGPGLWGDGVGAHIGDRLRPTLILAEKTGLQDAAFQASAERILEGALRDFDNLSFTDKIGALCLEQRILHRDNSDIIETFLKEHTNEATGLLFQIPQADLEDPEDPDTFFVMLIDTATVVTMFRESGIPINTEPFRAGAEAYYEKTEFKLPGEVKKGESNGSDALYFMGLFSDDLDLSGHLAWWEAWRESFIHKPIENESDLWELFSWINIEVLFSDDSVQRKINEYVDQMDLQAFLEAHPDSQDAYLVLLDILPRLSEEKREAVMEYCRIRINRQEEALLVPNIRDSYFGASLAKATGFSVDWEKLLASCGTMLEEQQSQADQDSYELVEALYYFALLTELLKEDVTASGHKAAEDIVKRCAKACMEKTEANEDGKALRRLSEVLAAQGISKDKKYVQIVRDTFDEFLQFEDGIIKKYSIFSELYLMDQSCGFKKITTADLQEVLSNLSKEGLYVADGEVESGEPELTATYWMSCLRSRVPELAMTEEELSQLSQKAAAHFQNAMESPDLADIYYYLCLKYCQKEAP